MFDNVAELYNPEKWPQEILQTECLIMAVNIIRFHNRDDYSDCLTKLNVVIENINATCITVIGDFYANLSKQSVFGEMLLNFCRENNADIVDKTILPADTYTYVSSAWGTTSWLDHVVCTSDAKDCTTHT